MSDNKLDKTNCKKDDSGRFESEKDLPLSRPLNDKEKMMIENFKKGKQNGK